MYNGIYGQQMNIDRINSQIAELERIKQQIPNQTLSQPTNLTQNFQIAPSNQCVIKYANTISDVQREIVIGDTPFFSSDMSIVWIKNIKGEIKTYELTEIIPKDDKDIKIEYLQAQIEELKRGMKNEQSDAIIDDDFTEPIKREQSSSVSTISKSNKKSK